MAMTLLKTTASLPQLEDKVQSTHMSLVGFCVLKQIR